MAASSRETTNGIPRARLEALGDAVYGVAMTLLVITIALPDSFKPRTAAEFHDALFELRPQLLVYAITFFVVGLRWLGSAQLGGEGERVDMRYAQWVMFNLFLITCLPFSTIAVGRYGEFTASTAIYGVNTILSALVSIRLAAMMRHNANVAAALRYNVALVVLIVSALLSIALAFVMPTHAMLPYLLNVVTPLFERVIDKWKPAGRR